MPSSIPLEILVEQVQSLHREYLGFVQATGDMERRIKSEQRWHAHRRVLVSGGEVTTKFPPVTDEDKRWVKLERATFHQALVQLTAFRSDALKKLIQCSLQLPGREFVESIEGVGVASLGAIVGDAGNLSNYPTPAHLWSRLGLGRRNVDGEWLNQRKVRDPKLAIKMAYSPTRRARVHVIGDCIVRNGGSSYARLYNERKEYETERVENAGGEVVSATKMTAAYIKKHPFSMSKMQVHKRAMRYIEKRFVRDLWRAWRRELGQKYKDSWLDAAD